MGILDRLWKQDGISQKELAARCFKDQPTTARILDKLEKRGFVIRKAHPDDKRAFLIYLTDKAMDMKTPFIEVGHRHLEQALKGLSNYQQEQLRILLNRVIDNLD
jgi:DNA-binding MarR family transcriptional regulator